MTPEEIAVELVDKFHAQASDYGTPHPRSLAKECAIICCEEVIKHLDKMWLWDAIDEQKEIIEAIKNTHN